MAGRTPLAGGSVSDSGKAAEVGLSSHDPMTDHCNKCGAEKPAAMFARKGECKDCKKTRMKEWRRKNQTAMSDKAADYREKNKEAIKARRAAQYLKNKEAILERNRAWRETNPEKAAEVARNHYQKQKEARALLPTKPRKKPPPRPKKPEPSPEEKQQAIDRRNAKAREYYYKNKTEINMRSGGSFRRRARRFGAYYETVKALTIFERDKWTCQICKIKTPKSHRGKKLATSPELDHIIPLARGGPHTHDNLQCLCRKCNGSKSDKTMGQLGLFAKNHYEKSKRIPRKRKGSTTEAHPSPR